MGKKRMTKSELIERIAVESGSPKSRVEKYTNLALDMITQTLKDGGTVQLSGFGTFYVKSLSERNGINPANLERIKIKARKAAAFKAGERLRGAIK